MGLSMQNETIYFVLQETSASSLCSLHLNGWIFITRLITVQLIASFFKRYGKCTWWLTECFTIMNCGAGSEISYRLLRLHQNGHGTYLGSNNKFNDLCDIVTSISIMCVTVLWTNGTKSPRCEFLCRNTHNKNTKLDLWPRVTKIPDEMKWKESKIIPIRSVTAHRLI